MKINAVKIETLLAGLGMNKTDLARLAATSPQSISTILRRGSCEPKTIGKLARALSLPIEDLLMEE